MEFRKAFGNRLKELRKVRKFTQDSIANLLIYESENCTCQLPTNGKSWSSYESGRTEPSLECLAIISKVLGVSADYLIGNSQEMLPQAKEFQQATGLSESAITNISKCKDYPEVMACINQFLSSEEFINAMENLVYAKTPASVIPRMKKTDEIIDGAKQASKRFSILLGKKKTDDSKITLTGKQLKEWDLWQAKKNLTNIVDSIVKGDKDNGTR